MKKYIVCPYCGKPPIWCDNKVIYGESIGKSHMCYICTDCDAYVGCHKNSRKPFGTLANKELRDLRRKAHELFDPLWKAGKMTRSDAYKMLSDTFGQEIHIGSTDVELCKKIIGLLTKQGINDILIN